MRNRWDLLTNDSQGFLGTRVGSFAPKSLSLFEGCSDGEEEAFSRGEAAALKFTWVCDGVGFALLGMDEKIKHISLRRLSDSGFIAAVAAVERFRQEVRLTLCELHTAKHLVKDRVHARAALLRCRDQFSLRPFGYRLEVVYQRHCGLRGLLGFGFHRAHPSLAATRWTADSSWRFEALQMVLDD